MIRKQEVTLEPGASQVVNFGVSPDEAKTYTVRVDGLQGSFVARAIEEPPVFTASIKQLVFYYTPMGQSWEEYGDPQECILGGMSKHRLMVRVENTTIGQALPLDVKVTITRPSGTQIEQSCSKTLRAAYETSYGYFFPDGTCSVSFSTAWESWPVEEPDVGLWIMNVELSAFGQVLDTVTKECVVEPWF